MAYKRKKRKAKRGKVYLLGTLLEDGMYVYKFGCTTKSTTTARAKWIGNKFKTTFNELVTFDVSDIYAREKDFSYFFRSSYKMLDYDIDLEWEEYIYKKSWETLASKRDISKELISIMREVCNG